MNSLDFKDTTENRYALQLSLYRCILERHYGIRISESMLVAIKPQRPNTFQTLRVPYYKDAALQLLGTPPEWMFYADKEDNRDSRLIFDDESHEYTILSCDGTDAWQAKSVTTLVSSLFPAFDHENAIRMMKSGAKWGPEHTMWGLDDATIVAKWKASGAKAAAAGTLLHNTIETFYKTGYLDDSIPGVKGFLEFKKTIADWTPVRSEWRIFSGDVAGTADMVYSLPDGTHALVDWKFTKKYLSAKRLKPILINK